MDASPTGRSALIPSRFSDNDKLALLDICREIRFVDSLEREIRFIDPLENVRADYATLVNYATIMKMDRRERESLPDDQRAEWNRALAVRQKLKITSPRDIEVELEALAKQADALLETLDNLDGLVKVTLHTEGLGPLIRERGEIPGLDRGLLVRLRDCLYYLSYAAQKAMHADCGRHALSRGWKQEAMLIGMREIADVFTRHQLPVRHYKPQAAYDGSQGSQFYQACRIVLSHEPTGRAWDVFWSQRGREEKN